MPTREERARHLAEEPCREGDRARLAAQLSEFELSGGNIVNIVQFAAISAIADGREEIAVADAMKGIQREVEKEGKVFAGVTAS